MKQSTLFAAAAGLALSVVLLQGCKGSNDTNMGGMDNSNASMSAPAEAPAQAPSMPAEQSPAMPSMPAEPAAPAMPNDSSMGSSGNAQ